MNEKIINDPESFQEIHEFTLTASKRKKRIALGLVILAAIGFASALLQFIGVY